MKADVAVRVMMVVARMRAASTATTTQLPTHSRVFRLLLLLPSPTLSCSTAGGG